MQLFELIFFKISFIQKIDCISFFFLFLKQNILWLKESSFLPLLLSLFYVHNVHVFLKCIQIQLTLLLDSSKYFIFLHACFPQYLNESFHFIFQVNFKKILVNFQLVTLITLPTTAPCCLEHPLTFYNCAIHWLTLSWRSIHHKPIFGHEPLSYFILSTVVSLWSIIAYCIFWSLSSCHIGFVCLPETCLTCIIIF